MPPWMTWPRIEAKMYFPRLVTSRTTSSISTILLPTRNMMPKGMYLRDARGWKFPEWTQQKENKNRDILCHMYDFLCNRTYHMIQDTSTMVASLKALKKRMSSSPSSPSFLRATPNTMANSTRPRMFMPSVSVPKGT